MAKRDMWDVFEAVLQETAQMIADDEEEIGRILTDGANRLSEEQNERLGRLRARVTRGKDAISKARRTAGDIRGQIDRAPSEHHD
jgi:hypothetical protein